jgi:hypothetical protein
MRLVRRYVTRYLAGNGHITYRIRRHAYLNTDRYSSAESCILYSSSGCCMGFILSKFTLAYVYGRKEEICKQLPTYLCRLQLLTFFILKIKTSVLTQVTWKDVSLVSFCLQGCKGMNRLLTACSAANSFGNHQLQQ